MKKCWNEKGLKKFETEDYLQMQENDFEKDGQNEFKNKPNRVSPMLSILH
ncbi:MAG: hypothetical protein R2778_10865 [Saprospiraceae bacterium]